MDGNFTVTNGKLDKVASEPFEDPTDTQQIIYKKLNKGKYKAFGKIQVSHSTVQKKENKRDG